MGFQILAQFRWGTWGFHRFYGVPTHNLRSVCLVSPNSIPIHQQGAEAGGRCLQLSWSKTVVVHSLVVRIQFNNIFGPELCRSSFPQLHVDEDRKCWLCSAHGVAQHPRSLTFLCANQLLLSGPLVPSHSPSFKCHLLFRKTIFDRSAPQSAGTISNSYGF